MNKTIALNVLLNEDATVAEAQGSSLSEIGTLSATGSAKRHPNDYPDQNVGFNLAVARALRALADKYEDRANYAMDGPPTLTFNGTLSVGTYTHR